VARIALNDGSSSTNRSLDGYDKLYSRYAVTRYAFFRYALYTVVTHVSYANSVTRFIRRQYSAVVASFVTRTKLLNVVPG